MSESDRKESAKGALLKAATALFSERGYDAVSTREIAEAAGVNLGAIQYHFGAKSKLFLEAIHELMDDSGWDELEEDLRADNIATVEEAAQKIGRFVTLSLTHFLRTDGCQASRMMYREIFTGTCEEPEMHEALVSSVVSSCSGPLEEMLSAIIKKMNPQAKEEDLRLSAGSIMALCSYYFTHRPFVERLWEAKLADSPMFEKLVTHVARFSLRALGCDEVLVSKVIRTVERRIKAEDAAARLALKRGKMKAA